MPKITVKVDTSLCIAAANCVGIAPHYFRIGDDNFAEVTAPGGGSGHEKTLEVDAHGIELLEEAVDSCPTRAIEIATT